MRFFGTPLSRASEDSDRWLWEFMVRWTERPLETVFVFRVRNPDNFEIRRWPQIRVPKQFASPLGPAHHLLAEPFWLKLTESLGDMMQRNATSFYHETQRHVARALQETDRGFSFLRSCMAFSGESLFLSCLLCASVSLWFTLQFVFFMLERAFVSG